MREVRAAVGVAVLPVSGRTDRATARAERIEAAVRAALEGGIDPHDAEAIRAAVLKASEVES